jgi:competence protein ComEC
MPVALFHFHQAGLYGALANIVAIPLTTFVIMPVESLALLLDLVGLGAPLWWVAGLALKLLLALAHATAEAPGAVALLPAMPGGAYALMAGGGLWVALWRTRARWLGIAPAAMGAAWALATPAPDLLVTGDGRHLALRAPDGGMALLRERAGDYTRTMLAENAGVEAALGPLGDRRWTRCSQDLCVAEVVRGGRRWRIAATRSRYLVSWRELMAVCASVDIVVSERRLPPACAPRWLKLDRPALAQSGGMAVTLAGGTVRSVRAPGARHPWLDPPRVSPPLMRSLQTQDP